MTEVRCSVASTAELPPWRALALAVVVHGLGAALLYGASATTTLPALPAPGLTLTLVSLPPAPAAPAAATPPQFAHKQPAPPTRSPYRNDAAVVHHVVHQPDSADRDSRHGGPGRDLAGDVGDDSGDDCHRTGLSRPFTAGVNLKSSDSSLPNYLSSKINRETN